MVDEEVVLKNPSEAVEEVETLAEEFYNKTLILEKGNISLNRFVVVILRFVSVCKLSSQ